jgi:hypothetical protein
MVAGSVLTRVRERRGEVASIRVSSTSALSQQNIPLSRITVTAHTNTHIIIIIVPSHPPPLNYLSSAATMPNILV